MGGNQAQGGQSEGPALVMTRGASDTPPLFTKDAFKQLDSGKPMDRKATERILTKGGGSENALMMNAVA